MYNEVLADASFPASLLALDVELAEQTRARGCPHCGGALHAALYLRKPRGGPWSLGAEQAVRHSFCCAREGCRRRVLPPSVRFLGRRVYLAAIVVLGAVLQQGPSAQRLARLASYVRVDRRTLARWRRWWLEQAKTSRSAQLALRAFVPPVARDSLPRSLLDRFAGGASERLRLMLQWLNESRFSAEPGRPAEDAR